jgi:ABC-2 type transport system ATP-binding protein
MADAVHVEDLRVVRGGRVVLPGISFAVARGRVTGLLGPSGSGKTTLMRAIVGATLLALALGAATLRRRTP